MGTVLALRHVAFEDLDGFAGVFSALGHEIRYWDAWYDGELPDVTSPEIMVVLGSPTGVYEARDYDFITAEIDAIKRRVDAGRPVLGLCFGAQLLAAALGARVYKGEHYEFGWSPISLSPAGEASAIRHYASPGRAVFHCHGDTFDLPDGATHLASTSLYENQSFSYGPHLGLQFHGEVTERGLKRWFIGHAALIKSRGGLSALRHQTGSAAPLVEPILDQVIADWLNQSMTMHQAGNHAQKHKIQTKD